VAAGSPKTNVAISPLSVADVLALLGHAADGDTARQLEQVLALPVRGNPQKAANELAAVSDPEGPVLVRSALWLPVSLKLHPSFEAKPFTASTLLLPAGATEAAAKINGWASDATHGVITDIVDASLDTTGFVVTNATYFKGVWGTRFDPEATMEKDFYAHDQPPHRVPMMRHSDIRVRYWSKEDLEAVRLPFRGNELEYIIITSKSRRTGDELLTELAAGGPLESICRGTGFVRRRGVVEIPKHRVAFGMDMKETLKHLGLTLPFAPGARFTRLSDTPLAVSSFRHRVVLVVDENGAEAAAATAAATTRSAFGDEPSLNFVADRPFVALLVNRDAPAWPLMMTVVRDL
jgi:serine protease inhibitor